MLAFFILICCSFRIPPDNETDKIVMKAAESQLSIYLDKIQQGHEKEYGFTNEDNRENCEVGKPYRLIVFNNEFYNGDLVEYTNYLEIKSQWRVPVILTGTYRVLLTVDGNVSNLTVSGIGGTELAKVLQEKSKGMNVNDAFYLLRVFQISAEFFVSEPGNSFDEAKFIPLPSALSAISALNKNKKPSYTLDEVQQMVKEALTNKPVNKEPATKKKTNTKSKKKAVK